MKTEITPFIYIAVLIFILLIISPPAESCPNKAKTPDINPVLVYLYKGKEMVFMCGVGSTGVLIGSPEAVFNSPVGIRTTLNVRDEAELNNNFYGVKLSCD